MKCLRGRRILADHEVHSCCYRSKYYVSTHERRGTSFENTSPILKLHKSGSGRLKRSFLRFKDGDLPWIYQ